MDTVKHSLVQAREVLDRFIEDEENISKIISASQLFSDVLNSGKKIISFGNGGSMADAIHFAEELSGQFRDERKALAAIAISDPAHITCTANDYGFGAIFSRFIEGLGSEGDAVLAISTSGNSANVVKAAEVAREKQIKVVSLTGHDGGKLKGLSDININVPFLGYSDRIQEMHIKIIHIIIESIEKNLG
jgi:D-sedoheptulose 7-phosphate isomerase